jgi:hypothetical protein
MTEFARQMISTLTGTTRLSISFPWEPHSVVDITSIELLDVLPRWKAGEGR